MGANYVLPPITGSRGLSPEIFRRFKIDAMLQDPHYGTFFFDDFIHGVSSAWTKTNLNSASATFVASSGRGGQATLSPGGTTDNHGGQVQAGAGAFKVEAGKSFAWEALVKPTTWSTVPQSILGLASTDTTLLGATGGEAATDFFGFYGDGADLNLDFLLVDNDTASATKASAATVVSGTWIKLGGLCIDGTQFIPFVNGVAQPDSIISGLATSALPELWLAPSMGIVGAGTVTPTFVIDWFAAVSGDFSSIL